ncbi:hypothetical protein ACK4A1_01670 [Aeromonas veronii]
MRKQLCQFILNMLNWSPFIHVSDDELFGSVSADYKKRISLIEFPLGKWKFYFFTRLKEKNDKAKYNFFHLLDFDSVCKIKSEQVVNEKVTDYKCFISGLDDELIRNQIEFLKDKISMNQARIASGYNKTNMYVAIVLVYFGFVLYLIGKVVNLATINYWLFFLTFFVGYNAFNCACFIKSSLSIRGYIRSSFRSIKNDASIKELACAYYRDWYSTNNEGDVITSYVGNVEKYFTRSLVVSVLVLGILSIGDKTDLFKGETMHHNNEFLIFNETGEFQKSEFILLVNKINEGSEKVFIINSKGEKKGALIRDFIRTTVSDPERVVEISLENKVVNSKVIIVKLNGVGK